MRGCWRLSQVVRVLFSLCFFIYVPTVLSEGLAQAMPHLGTVGKGIRIVAEVNKQEHELESTETEANIQE